jgi:hypothetical protein
MAWHATLLGVVEGAEGFAEAEKRLRLCVWSRAHGRACARARGREERGAGRRRACVRTARLTDAAYLHCAPAQLSLVSGVRRRKFRAG